MIDAAGKTGLYFIHIPKTGGTYVYRGAFGRSDLGPAFSKKITRPVNTGWHCFCSSVENNVIPTFLRCGGRANLAGVEDMLIFATVRNPFDHLASLFASEGGNGWDGIAIRFKGDFPAFIRAWVDPSYDPNWCPQLRRSLIFQLFNDDGACVADYVIRSEQIDEGLDLLCNAVGVTREHPPSRLNDTPGRPCYQAMFTPELRRLVEDAYRGDLEMLGYSFEGTADGRVLIPGCEIRRTR